MTRNHRLFDTRRRALRELNWLTCLMLTRCEEIMREVCASFECELLEFMGDDEHVHLLVGFSPKVALSALVPSAISDKRVKTRRATAWPGEISVINRSRHPYPLMIARNGVDADESCYVPRQ